MKLLYRYCTALDIGVKPLKMIRCNDEKIQSIKRTWHNLKLEHKGTDPIKDDKFLRFIELRGWIKSLKNGNGEVTLRSKDMLGFTKGFNNRNGRVYNQNDIRGVVEDLHDIFDVEVRIETKEKKKYRLYIVKEEWTPSKHSRYQFHLNHLQYN